MSNVEPEHWDKLTVRQKEEWLIWYLSNFRNKHIPADFYGMWPTPGFVEKLREWQQILWR